MRTVKEIVNDAYKHLDRDATRDNVQAATLEVLLDIRELLQDIDLRSREIAAHTSV